MPALTAQQREEAWREWMGRLAGPCVWDKPLLRQAADAANAWLDNNTTAFNNALPAAFRNSATTDQKIDLLIAVLRRKRGH